MEDLNRSIYLAINQYAGQSQIIDQMSVVFADKLPYLFIFFLIFIWCASHLKSDVQKSHALKQSVLTSGYAAIAGVSINRLITAMYFHPRPFMDKLGTILGEHKAEGSFPSDHTTFVLCLALTWFAFKETRHYGIYFTVLALVSGILRVYIGVHYPFDILASLCVSLLIVGLFRFVFHQKIEKLNSLIISIYDNLYQRFMLFLEPK